VFAAAVEFLVRVDQDGVRRLQRHMQAISDFRPPPDVKQLQQFLGIVNFYRRFLPGIARTLQPLTDALKGIPKMLEWPPAAAAAFGAPWYHWRTQPQTPCSLSPQTPRTRGRRAQQLTGWRWQPLAFYSKKLSGAAPATPPSTESCWPLSARSDISGSYWRGDNSAY
jgi:cleavage and polyadenylation specificity factor subunit 1